MATLLLQKPTKYHLTWQYEHLAAHYGQSFFDEGSHECWVHAQWAEADKSYQIQYKSYVNYVQFHHVISDNLIAAVAAKLGITSDNNKV